MAGIKVIDIYGVDLFSDSESFMIEINNDEDIIMGGIIFYPICIPFTNGCHYGGESQALAQIINNQ